MQHLPKPKWKLPWLMVALLPLLLAAGPPADSGAAGPESQPQQAAAPAPRYYNGKAEVPSLVLLRVTAPRDFHANVGTVSLKYGF